MQIKFECIFDQLCSICVWFFNTFRFTFYPDIHFLLPLTCYGEDLHLPQGASLVFVTTTTSEDVSHTPPSDTF